jgi:hypothetical protein
MQHYQNKSFEELCELFAWYPKWTGTGQENSYEGFLSGLWGRFPFSECCSAVPPATPVPEVGTLLMILAGLGVFMLLHLKRFNRHEH